MECTLCRNVTTDDESKALLDDMSKLMELPASWDDLSLSKRLQCISILVLRAVKSAEDKKLLLLLPEHIIINVVNKLRELMDCSEGCEKCTQEQRVYHLRRLLISLSKTWKRLPRCMFLKEVQLEDAHTVNGGSYGDIFKASFRGQLVALKRPKVYTMVPRMEKQDSALRREALLSWFLNHPNVQPFVGIIEDTLTISPPLLCIVTPWQRNGTILDLLRRLKSLHLPILVDVWIKGIAKGLCYLHDNEIIHGDLRAGNILVDDHYIPKLTDFGLSTLWDAGTATLGSFSSRGHIGTLRFTAPELLKADDAKATSMSDVYSFGCMCFELFTLKAPFWDRSDAQVFASILASQQPIIPSDSPYSHPGFWPFVKRCWDSQPSQRPSSRSLVDSLPLRISPLSASNTGQCPDVEWKTTLPTKDGSETGSDTCVLNSRLLHILDIGSTSTRGQPPLEELACLSSICCPENVIKFAETCLRGWSNSNDALTEEAPLLDDVEQPDVDESIYEESGNKEVGDDDLDPSEHADACYKQATHHRDQKRYRRAVEWGLKAVELRRHLTQKDPDAFSANLALSLSILAFNLTRLGEYKEAAMHGREALQLRRQLAQKDPDAFNADLAISLHNLAPDLRELGEYKGAVGHSREAVQLRRQLAELDPDAFSADLAVSLHNLAFDLRELGEYKEAAEHDREAIQLRRRLAQRDPDAFNAKLADSLRNLAIDLRELERFGEATKCDREADRLCARST